MDEFLHDYGYLALMVGTFLEGETAILLAASLVYTGFFDGPQTVLFAFLGSFASDWLYYLVGRINGTFFIDRRPPLKARLESVRNFFQEHRVQILFSYRFLYGFRIILPLLIGLSGVRPLHFLGYSVAAGLLWSTTVTTVGYVAGAFFQFTPGMFQENLLLVILSFGAFGALLGLAIKGLAQRRMRFSPGRVDPYS